MSGPTKAELVEQLTEKAVELDRLRQTTRLDPDAQAINACVKALDPLSESRSSSLYRSTPSASVERVLLYLRHRYGIPDASAEVGGLRAELEQSGREAQALRDRLSSITQAAL